MIRKAFVMQLDAGKVDEYRRRHNPIWPELEAVLIEHGVFDYSIYLHPETFQLFAYAEVARAERWSAIARTEVCQKWWQFMRDLMETNMDNSPASVELEEVFRMHKPLPL